MINYRQVFKNASWLVACRIVRSIVAVFITMISARYLGPSNYGLLSYAISVVAFVVPLAQLGLNNTLVDEIISRPEQEGKILGTTFVLSIVSSLFCILGCAAFVSIANAGETETLIICLLYSSCLIFEMLEMIQYWYQAKLLSKYTAVTSLIVYFIVAAYKIFLLITQKSVYWFALSYTFDYLMIAGVLLVFYKKLGGQKITFSFSLGKQLFSRSRHYILAGLMITVFAQTDKIMLKMLIGNAENGYYATAVASASIFGFVFVAIIDSLRPVILESKKYDQKQFEKNTALLYSLIIYLGLAQSVVLTLFAKPIVNILYGEAYLPAVPVLQVITWYSAFSYMGSIRNIWMLAEEKHNYLWFVNFLGAILNVIGNFILIPIWGAVGAAIASVVTQFFTNFILCFIFAPIRKNGRIICQSLNPTLLLSLLKIQKKKD